MAQFHLGDCFEGDIIMKTAAILLATLSLGFCAAGAAAAAEHLSDVDYLKANRCRGIAEGLGAGDTAGLDGLIKAEGRSRVEPVYERGQQELARGKRDATTRDARERLSAELNGPCMAYLGAGKDAASARRAAPRSTSPCPNSAESRPARRLPGRRAFSCDDGSGTPGSPHAFGLQWRSGMNPTLRRARLERVRESLEFENAA